MSRVSWRSLVRGSSPSLGARAPLGAFRGALCLRGESVSRRSIQHRVTENFKETLRANQLSIQNFFIDDSTLLSYHPLNTGKEVI